MVDPIVFLVIVRVLVVLVTVISSPSSSMVTEPAIVESKRGSASSVTEHSAPVGRLSITSGVLAVMVWSASTSGLVTNPPVHVMSTMKGSSPSSTPGGTPSRTLVTVSDAVLRSFTKLMLGGSASAVAVMVCEFGVSSAQPAGTVSVTVQTVPFASGGSSV